MAGAVMSEHGTFGPVPDPDAVDWGRIRRVTVVCMVGIARRTRQPTRGDRDRGFPSVRIEAPPPPA
jgi:hypothetical protein